MPAVSAPVRVCGAETPIPPRVAELALSVVVWPGKEVEEVVSCAVEDHPDDEEHWSLVRELDGPHTGAVWVVWTDRIPPYRVRQIPDCRVINPEGQACPLYEGHPGRCPFDSANPPTTSGTTHL
ncbi:hypothetical protein [Streptomyces sp. SID11385]|uniref:hypothetical protein n=1 Tax=Streptomyces sp. SID11385 TaxID=2706031 RepID=UPI001EF28380|nr:hypothetical protein [Streptomyces sp. SID11385]